MARNRHRQRGSVIVLAVGLLVMLAMVGSTFIIIAYLDRRESRGLALTAPMDDVAMGILDQLVRDRMDNLYIASTAAGPDDDVVYGLGNDYRKYLQYPHEDFDRALASVAPVKDGANPLKWLHLTNWTGSGSGYANVNLNAGTLVDTDGVVYEDPPYGGDARLKATQVSTRARGQYYGAVRMIPADSLLNVNTAYAPQSAAVGAPMPAVSVDLGAMTGDPIRNAVHAVRSNNTNPPIADYNRYYVVRPMNPDPAANYLTYDDADMLALIWGDLRTTTTGRLYKAFIAGDAANGATTFKAVKCYLTARSAARDYVRFCNVGDAGVGDGKPLAHRADLNATNDNFNDLFKAFYSAIYSPIPADPAEDAARRTVAAQLAAQLAVNVMDYRDANDVVTVKDVPGASGKVYGIERQPFIVEAWLRMEWDASANGGAGGLKVNSAIELWNPYKSDIVLTGWKLGAQVLDGLPGMPGSLPPNGRLVLASDAAAILRMATPVCVVGALDLTQSARIFRPAGSGQICVGWVNGLEEFGWNDGNRPTAATPAPVFRALRRDDNPGRGRYSVAVYKRYDETYLIGDLGCPPDANSSNLGNLNNLNAGDLNTVFATPVYVRNDKFINLGDVLRLYYVGPTDSTNGDKPLDVVLAGMAPTEQANGRLNLIGALKPQTTATTLTPALPPACMLGDYLAALVPSPQNTGGIDTLYGQININTAPWQVIRYVPGISSLTQDLGVHPDDATKRLLLRERVAREIVAYRDGQDNTRYGGRNYYYNWANPADPANKPRATVTGIAGLRAVPMLPLPPTQDPGFASCGEVAIPIRFCPGLLPSSYGGNAPDAYKIADSGSDDGLDEIPSNANYQNDPNLCEKSKAEMVYAWLSNHITVRSDIFIAYILVQTDAQANTAGAKRRYVAVIDRTNCRLAFDATRLLADCLPRVLMFSEIK